MHAVVLAGGKGTRLRPLTDTRPKPLLPFVGDPFAVGLLRRLTQAGVNAVTFLVGDDAAPWSGLRDAVDGVRVRVVTEEVPLDTAGAARRLFHEGGVDGPVLVCNGDICTDVDLGAALAAHEAAGATATIVLTRVVDTSAFGVVVRDAAGLVERFVEKPPPGTIDENTVNAGTYILAPEAFAGLPGDGPLSFERKVFPGLVEAGRVVLGVDLPAYWQDLGTPARYLDGHRDVLEGRCAWPVGEGLETRAPGVLVHATAEVDPAGTLEAPVVVGAHARVGARAVVGDAVLHARAVVEAGATVRRSILGEGARIPEGFVVPPGTVLGDGEVART